MTTKNRTTITAEPNTQNIVITRVISAPRERVFEAHTNADLFAQWVGPRNLKMDLQEFTCVPGGTFRFVHTDPEGNAYGFRGVFHDVVENERIVQTFEFNGYPGHVSLETLTLEDVEGGTLIRAESVYGSVEDRDGMAQSGMEEGVNDGYERLEELLGAK
jgi:uncharacterized protein YndB with AHSA1/START domain